MARAKAQSQAPKVNALLNKPRKERPPCDQRDLVKYPRTRGDDWEQNPFEAEMEWQEFVRCSQSVEYFISQYCCVVHPEDGLVPCILYGYQRTKVLSAFLNERFVITRKFRQGGFSTVAALTILWMMLFETDLKVLVVSKGDREAKEFLTLIKMAYDYLPDFLRAVLVKNNDHVMETDSGCRVMCHTPKASVSFSCKLIVIDEAAHIEQNMHKVWGKIYPVVSAGGRCWVISTCNGVVGHGEWYYKTWTDADAGKNFFFPLDVAHTEHPFYQDSEWEAKTRANIGEYEWRQQYMREFISESNSIFREENIAMLMEWAEDPIEIHPCPLLPPGNKAKNLWFWEKKVSPDEDFIIIADPSEGNGENDENGYKNDDYDFATIQVISMKDLRQVAEYQNDAIKPQDLAKVAQALAIMYNNGTVVCEAGPHGQNFFSHLIDILGYDNFYCSDPSKKVGLIISGANRPKITTGATFMMQKGLVRIRSKRTIHELRTLIWNTKLATPRIDHMKNYHDDLFTGLAYGYYVREELLRQLPPGMTREYKPIHEFSQSDIDRLVSRISNTPDAVVNGDGDVVELTGNDDLILPATGDSFDSGMAARHDYVIASSGDTSWQTLDGWGKR